MTQNRSIVKGTEILGSPGSTNLPVDNKYGSTIMEDNLDWVVFGSDNLFPQAIAYLNRKAAVHRGIINNKTTYITGKGFICDEKEKELFDLLINCNSEGESLRKVYKRKVYDKQSYGNGWLELVTDRKRTFLNFYHHDATKCRVGKNKLKGYAVLHPNWSNVNNSKNKLKAIPFYPNFEKGEDGNLHAMIQIKDYESEFVTYGVMNWIAGLGASSIAYKTDTWNISRLDNSYKYSGILMVDAEFKDEEEEEQFNKDVDAVYSGEGNQGRVLKVKKPMESDGTKFIPFETKTEGDWITLHSQSESSLVIAHSWFRTLTGIVDNTGFDTQRILNEYQVALATVIEDEQQEFLEIYKMVIQNELGLDASSLAIINKPPILEKPSYMKVWEARKADGMDYDENDPTQNIYIAEMGKAKTITLQ